MGTAEELVTYLDAQSTSFTAGTNLFAHFLPDTAVAACAVYETARGLGAVEKFGGLPAATRPGFEVVCRSTTPVGPGPAIPTTARSLAQRAWLVLGQVTNASLSGTTWMRIEAAGDPYMTGRDEAGRVVFTVGFVGSRRPSTSIL